MDSPRGHCSSDFHLSQWCLELWNCHVGGAVIWWQAIWEYDQSRGDEKLRGRVPASPTCGLPIHPLWANEELLVTWSNEEASFPGDPGTAATLQLKPPSPSVCCRLWSQGNAPAPQLQRIWWYPLSIYSRVAGIHSHEALYLQLSHCWPWHHGVNSGPHCWGLETDGSVTSRPPEEDSV